MPETMRPSRQALQILYQTEGINHGSILGILNTVSVMATAVKNKSKTERNRDFCNTNKCDLPQVNTSVDFSMVIKNFLALDQFIPYYLTKIP